MGGSGGGSYSIRERQLKTLEEKAKDALKQGEPKKRSVFISFDHDNLDEVNLLRGQAKNTNSDLNFVDRSLHEPFNSKRAEYIKRGIRERIKQASVTVVYLTKESASSKWVNWEIKESIRQGKGIVAVYKGDSAPKTLPLALKKYGIKPVPWKHDTLMKAIEKAAKKRKPPKDK